MLDAKSREARRTRLGSSDLPAILGLDTYRSAADVWLEKTGRLTGEGKTSSAIDRGNLLEPYLLDWAETQLDQQIERDVMLMPSPDDGMRIANLDGRTVNHEIVEAKTTVLTDDWGEPYTDQVPERVLAQVHHQFAVAGRDFRVAYVPVLLPGFRTLDLRMYKIERNEELCEIITADAVDFMERFVRADVAPDDYRPSLETLKRVQRVPEKVVDVTDELFLRVQQARLRASEADKAKKAAEAELIAALGDAEGGACGAGTIAYMEQTRKAYEVAEATFRVLQLKVKK